MMKSRVTKFSFVRDLAGAAIMLGKASCCYASVSHFCHKQLVQHTAEMTTSTASLYSISRARFVSLIQFDGEMQFACQDLRNIQKCTEVTSD